MTDEVEKELLAEIEHLSRLVAEQNRAVADAVNEVRRSHAALGWRAQLRFERIGARLLRNPLLREPYRMARRAFESGSITAFSTSSSSPGERSATPPAAAHSSWTTIRGSHRIARSINGGWIGTSRLPMRMRPCVRRRTGFVTRPW
jgi:hypothetical protein